jgi:hypothetical protein
MDPDLVIRSGKAKNELKKRKKTKIFYVFKRRSAWAKVSLGAWTAFW